MVSSVYTIFMCCYTFFIGFFPGCIWFSGANAMVRRCLNFSWIVCATWNQFCRCLTHGWALFPFFKRTYSSCILFFGANYRFMHWPYFFYCLFLWVACCFSDAKSMVMRCPQFLNEFISDMHPVFRCPLSISALFWILLLDFIWLAFCFPMPIPWLGVGFGF